MSESNEFGTGSDTITITLTSGFRAWANGGGFVDILNFGYASSATINSPAYPTGLSNIRWRSGWSAAAVFDNVLRLDQAATWPGAGQTLSFALLLPTTAAPKVLPTIQLVKNDGWVYSSITCNGTSTGQQSSGIFSGPKGFAVATVMQSHLARGQNVSLYFSIVANYRIAAGETFEIKGFNTNPVVFNKIQFRQQQGFGVSSLTDGDPPDFLELNLQGQHDPISVTPLYMVRGKFNNLVNANTTIGLVITAMAPAADIISPSLTLTISSLPGAEAAIAGDVLGGFVSFFSNTQYPKQASHTLETARTANAATKLTLVLRINYDLPAGALVTVAVGTVIAGQPAGQLAVTYMNTPEVATPAYAPAANYTYPPSFSGAASALTPSFISDSQVRWGGPTDNTMYFTTSLPLSKKSLYAFQVALTQPAASAYVPVVTTLVSSTSKAVVPWGFVVSPWMGASVILDEPLRGLDRTQIFSRALGGACAIMSASISELQSSSNLATGASTTLSVNISTNYPLVAGDRITIAGLTGVTGTPAILTAASSPAGVFVSPTSGSLWTAGSGTLVAEVSSGTYVFGVVTGLGALLSLQLAFQQPAVAQLSVTATVQGTCLDKNFVQDAAAVAYGPPAAASTNVFPAFAAAGRVLGGAKFFITRKVVENVWSYSRANTLTFTLTPNYDLNSNDLVVISGLKNTLSTASQPFGVPFDSSHLSSFNFYLASYTWDPVTMQGNFSLPVSSRGSIAAGTTFWLSFSLVNPASSVAACQPLVSLVSARSDVGSFPAYPMNGFVLGGLPGTVPLSAVASESSLLLTTFTNVASYNTYTFQDNTIMVTVTPNYPLLTGDSVLLSGFYNPLLLQSNVACTKSGVTYVQYYESRFNTLVSGFDGSGSYSWRCYAAGGGSGGCYSSVYSANGGACTTLADGSPAANYARLYE